MSTVLLRTVATVASLWILMNPPGAAADDAIEGAAVVPTERRLRIVDEDGRPLPDATVTVSVTALPTVEHVTNAGGFVHFQYADLAGVNLSVVKDGYARMRWQPAVPGQPLTEDLEIRLPRGTSAGGIVVDDGGNPVEGAEVRISVSEVRAGSRAPDRPYSALEHYVVHTNADGLWKTDVFPPWWSNLAIWVSHPDFIVWEFAPIRRPNREPLLHGDWRVVIPRGVKLKGVVSNELDEPVSGAAIAYGPADGSESSWAVTHSADDGEFMLGALPEGDCSYVVVARGYTPCRFTAPAAPGVPSLSVRLSQGRELSVKFLDEHRQPVRDVEVRIWNWEGDAAAEAVGVGRDVDAQGLWLWDGMPNEPFQLRVYSDDYMTEEFPITPDRTEYVYVLRAVPKVRYVGRVIDAWTGEPIERFTLRPLSSDQPLYLHREFVSEKGVFRYEAPSPHGPASLEVQADGYGSQVFGPFTSDDSPVRLEARLRSTERSLRGERSLPGMEADSRRAIEPGRESFGDYLIAFFVACLAAAIPTVFYVGIAWWLDRYEKEPWWLMALAFVWGAVPAIILAAVVELVFSVPLVQVLSEQGVETVTAAVVAPLVEEPLKALPLLLIFWLFYNEFDGLLDGLIYGALVGFGFAMTENVMYIFGAYTEAGYAGLFGVAFLRVIVLGMMHALWASMFGLGLGIARYARSPLLAWTAPPAGLLLGMSLHAFHNFCAVMGGFWPLLMFASYGLGCIGWLVLVILAGQAESRWIRQELKKEVALGHVRADVAKATSRYRSRVAARWAAFQQHGVGHSLRLAHLYSLAADLAFKKRQYRIHPHKRRFLKEIDRLRGEIADVTASLFGEQGLVSIHDILEVRRPPKRKPPALETARKPPRRPDRPWTDDPRGNSA